VQPVNIPAALTRNFAWIVVEILIVGFQETVMYPVSVKARPGICAKQDAVRISHKEPAGSVWLAAQFANTSADINEEVRATLNEIAHPAQILRITAHMSADKRGLWVA
jgi:hypothetical protein